MNREYLLAIFGGVIYTVGVIQTAIGEVENLQGEMNTTNTVKILAKSTLWPIVNSYKLIKEEFTKRRE